MENVERHRTTIIEASIPVFQIRLGIRVVSDAPITSPGQHLLRATYDSVVVLSANVTSADNAVVKKGRAGHVRDDRIDRGFSRDSAFRGRYSHHCGTARIQFGLVDGRLKKAQVQRHASLRKGLKEGGDEFRGNSAIVRCIDRNQPSHVRARGTDTAEPFQVGSRYQAAHTMADEYVILDSRKLCFDVRKYLSEFESLSQNRNIGHCLVVIRPSGIATGGVEVNHEHSYCRVEDVCTIEGHDARIGKSVRHLLTGQ